MTNFWGSCGAVSAMLAVILGAFAAHGLDKQFGEQYADAAPKMLAGHPIPAAQKALADFKTGADYQFWHAFGMLMVGLLVQKRASRLLHFSGVCFLLGTLLFSGSLYLLTLLNQPKFGMIAPLGGTLFILGWAGLAMVFAKQPSTPGQE